MTNGTRLGPYEIVAPLGAGGMGEVYRAHDTQLKRDVALKVLPAGFANDPERLARFRREAELLATLNHPHIAAIYGLERTGTATALVLELVDGDTLAERIGRGRIPIEEALSIARQIADALVAAHERNIIHRDLKPGNVKVRPDGTVKVLDFGLAKAMGPPESGHVYGDRSVPRQPDVTASPTIAPPAMTQIGMILGTAAYVSPEQAKGRAADRRSDIWAFGCVVYEMLTGRALFARTTVTETLAAVLEQEIDWTQLPATTPPELQRLLRRCLEKNPGRRLHHIADARIEVEDAVHGRTAGEAVASGRRPAPSRRTRLEYAAAGVLIVAALVSGALLARAGTATGETPRELRFEITTPPLSDVEDVHMLAVSPDGRYVVFIGAADGQPQLWLRPLDGFEARVLPGTADAQAPFWSPDSRSLAFFAEGSLKRFDLDGDAVRILTSAAAGWGGTWNADGIILFTPTPASPIMRVAANGGTPEPVTLLEKGHAGHWFPQFLPDGRHFTYFVEGDVRGAHVARLGASDPPRRLDISAPVSAFGADHLFFARDGQVLAQPFDADRLEITGRPVVVANGVTSYSGLGYARVGVGGNVVAFRVGEVFVRRFGWVDRSGTVVRAYAEPEVGASPSLSPDGRSLAVLRRVGGNADVWLMDLQRGGMSRLTAHPAEDVFPVWSPGGDRLVFVSNRDGAVALYEMTPAGESSAKPLLHDYFGLPADWSPDGAFILLQPVDARGSGARGISAVQVETNAQPFLVVQAGFNERNGQFSPDGQWVAFQSDRSGRTEIYVLPFPGPGTAIAVSTNGGAQPRWRADGRELFYLSLDGRLMAVPVQPGRDGVGPPELGNPQALFSAHAGRVLTATPGAQYVVSRDGQRFLLNITDPAQSRTPIRVIVNWAPAAASN